MLSNGGFYLGKLLANENRREEVVRILKVLLKRHMNVLDRQLSSSGCSEHVIAMFFEKSDKNRQFVIDLFSNSICIREQMETERFIEQLLECSIPEKNRMIAAFSQTAWGRARLRTSGALDVVIDVFSSSEHIAEKLATVEAFRHFVHDTAGIRYLSENLKFVNTVVRDVNNYIMSNRCECEPSIDIEFVQKLSSSSRNPISDEKINTNMREPIDQLHKDFYSMWSYDTPQTSPRRAQSASLSPPYGVPSPSYSFPSSVASSASSSPAPQRSSEGILDDLSDVESENEDDDKKEEEKEDVKKKRQEKSIVEGELWLLTWLSQDDHNLQFLIRPDIVDCVVSYLRSTRDPEFRTYRILRRMSTHRTHIYQLLDLQFHVRILTGLCASPCRMLKYAKSCKQCDKCSEHGREILREFASHVDNSYGDAHINSQFTKEDFVHRTKGAIAKIVLVKERIRLAKVPALSELFNALAHVMSSPENFRELGKMTTYENGPSFVSQIIGALSILISGNKIKELCEHDMWYFPVEEGNGECALETASSDQEMLHFMDENDKEIAVAPMKNICENSHYFEGMYSSDFVEKTEGIRTFQVHSESCLPEEFRLFIHLLSTCTSSCTTVSSAEQCATLLALSDQFLCPTISKKLCADDGPLRTYLNGNSLHLLLPVALATNAHPTLLDTVFLTLVRFSSSENVTKALEAICENSTVVNTFVESLKTFLTTKC
ncbi:PUM-HD domain-containing protein [Caenorhabditis elegans]|nr:PUM-HD domain-containing protein [Caenorhabditis elegans]CAA96695.1 PUM-HD domain-containing protein [Caenorhabditis elegans]|eukprot:NP_492101.1 Uncharacterized protein CELE_T28F4.4 [Caenorhabditis elegans]